MEMIPVKSDVITHIGYDSNKKQMKITFIHGKTYGYCDVPKNIFDAFLNALLIGIYYDKHIKGNYNCW